VEKGNKKYVWRDFKTLRRSDGRSPSLMSLAWYHSPTSTRTLPTLASFCITTPHSPFSSLTSYIRAHENQYKQESGERRTSRILRASSMMPAIGAMYGTLDAKALASLRIVRDDSIVVIAKSADPPMGSSSPAKVHRGRGISRKEEVEIQNTHNCFLMEKEGSCGGKKTIWIAYFDSTLSF
jgi:hypothetical protein